MSCRTYTAFAFTFACGLQNALGLPVGFRFLLSFSEYRIRELGAANPGKNL